MNYLKRLLTKNKNDIKNNKIILITPVVSKVIKKKHFTPKNLKYNYKKGKKLNIIVPNINLKQLKINSSLVNIKSFINSNLLIPQEINNLIPFNAMKIITLIDHFEKLPLGFHLFKSTNLNIYISTQSEFSNDNYFGVTFYQINKNELYNKCDNKNYKLTLEDLSNIFSNPELRLLWDKSLYKFEILKQLEFNNNDLNPKGYIQKQIFNSPVFGVSKREMIDKKIFINFNNSLYTYQSSINEKIIDEFSQPDNDIVRALTIINSARYYEDDEYYKIVCFYQTDMRISIPETFIQLTIPFTINSYYQKYYNFLIDFINKKN
jgi:hypothetical protein